jgi:hypothetical protein
LDLDEELTHQELATLLDRALGHLPPGARAAVEHYYLAEESPREVALRLGLTINALEARLCRARQELRRVLNGPLRHEAASFDLTLDDESAQGWRPTRLWCHLCAKQHLVGRIEELPAGTGVDLRCPDCWPRYGIAEMQFDPHPWLRGLHTFRPAFKRVVQRIAPQAVGALQRPLPCPVCRAPAHSRLLAGEDVTDSSSSTGRRPAFTYLAFECRRCGHRYASPCAIAGSADPLIRTFMLSRSRWRLERSVLSTFQCSPAVYSRLVDQETGAGLAFFVHAKTLHVLATFAD